MISPALLVLGIAVAADLLVGEWPERIHPVAMFGQIIAVFDRSWARPTGVGVAIVLVLPGMVAVLLGALTATILRVTLVGGVLVGAAILFSTISLRMLVEVAYDVVALASHDEDRARAAVSALVGRDPSALSAGQLRSAVVESLAENLADGFVAPLTAFVIGANISLGVGIAAAVWVKGVNTMDSMLGYRSKPVGWASARMDDVVMWVPARLTAVLLAIGARDVGALRQARAWAHVPASPNSGWPMATLAVALDVTLEKPGAYRLHPGRRLPTSSDAERAVRITAMSGVIGIIVAGAVLWL